MTSGYTPAGYAFTAAYDAENRLKSLIYANGSGGVFSNQYIYRWTGYLAETKQYQNGLLSNDIRYVRSGYFPLQERNSNNAVVQEYAWDFRKGGGIAGLLNLINGGQSYSHVYDGKGNVAAVLDGSQNTAASYAYDPFGIPLGTGGILNQPFSFSSKPYDSLTGLSDFGFRFYAPALGRWLNRDPIGENGGVNLYSFVGDNPVQANDPLGLQAFSSSVSFCISETPLSPEEYCEAQCNGDPKCIEGCKSGENDLHDPPDTETPCDKICHHVKACEEVFCKPKFTLMPIPVDPGGGLPFMPVPIDQGPWPPSTLVPINPSSGSSFMPVQINQRSGLSFMSLLNH